MKRRYARRVRFCAGRIAMLAISRPSRAMFGPSGASAWGARSEPLLDAAVASDDDGESGSVGASGSAAAAVPPAAVPAPAEQPPDLRAQGASSRHERPICVLLCVPFALHPNQELLCFPLAPRRRCGAAGCAVQRRVGPRESRAVRCGRRLRRSSCSRGPQDDNSRRRRYAALALALPRLHAAARARSGRSRAAARSAAAGRGRWRRRAAPPRRVTPRSRPRSRRALAPRACPHVTCPACAC
jgi:hypothetical protein